MPLRYGENEKNFLREGLGSENNVLLLPLPHGDHEVWVAPDCGEVASVGAELQCGILRFRTVPQDLDQPKRRVFIDEDIRALADLPDGEELARGMHGEASDASPSQPVQERLLHCRRVQDHEDVADGLHDGAPVAVKEVVPLPRVEAEGVQQLQIFP